MSLVNTFYWLTEFLMHVLFICQKPNKRLEKDMLTYHVTEQVLKEQNRFLRINHFLSI